MILNTYNNNMKRQLLHFMKACEKRERDVQIFVYTISGVFGMYILYTICTRDERNLIKKKTFSDLFYE